MITRIQRKRTKGWRMPETAVYVGRPGKLGNPFIIRWGCVCFEMRDHNTKPGVYLAIRQLYSVSHLSEEEQLKEVVRCYREWLKYGNESLDKCNEISRLSLPIACIEQPPTTEEIRQFVNGRDVACWCSLDKPCHADVIIERLR